MNSKDIAVTVQIPYELYEKLKSRVEDSEFSSVESYIVHVLNLMLQDSKSKSSAAFDEKDEEELKKRLKSLGYI